MDRVIAELCRLTAARDIELTIDVVNHNRERTYRLTVTGSDETVYESNLNVMCIKIKKRYDSINILSLSNSLSQSHKVNKHFI